MADLYKASKEMVEMCGISHRHVDTICANSLIPSAAMVDSICISPSIATKQDDRRISVKNPSSLAKPFIKWAGGKTQLAEKIEDIFAYASKDIKKYAEPFIGSGAFMFHLLKKYSFDDIYISDKNAELINVYISIRDYADELISFLSYMQNDFFNSDSVERKELYYSLRSKFNNIKLSSRCSVEKAALFIFLNKTCFNGLYRVNRKGEYNVPIGEYEKPKICDKNNLSEVSGILKNVNIVCGDFTNSRNFIDNKTFVYFDPPYRPISNTASFTSYNSDVFDDYEQKRLANYIAELDKKGAKFVLSNSDPKNINMNDNFFDTLYDGFSINRIPASRMINCKANARGKINELLITNIY